MKISMTVKGNWNKTEEALKKKTMRKIRSILEKYGREGVAALSSATPIDTGLTASSWMYEIREEEESISIVFINNNKTSTNVPIAILLQYGHGNGHGGYVQGRDYINPAIQPIFDKITEEAWREIAEK